jgi:hypothetical protein
MLALTNGAQYWDFSQPQQDYETVLRTDIIDPADGMGGGSFTNALYAEQDTMETMESTNQNAWRYYSITNQGRIYYGSYVTNTDADGYQMFSPPTLDVPATVTNGQTWTRTTSWDSTIYTIFGPVPIDYQFSATANVDAYGTLVLPVIGAVPALRVHEVHGYIGTLDGSPEEIEIVTNQYYYWLVPGLGVAVQVLQYGNNILDPGSMPFTNSVERMFHASYFPVASPSLYIHLQSGSALLNWDTFPNSSSYQVQAIGSLGGTNWQLLGLTTTNSWSDTLSTTQRFYRVVGIP